LKYRWNTITQSQKGAQGKEVVEKYSTEGTEMNKYLRSGVPVESIKTNAEELDKLIYDTKRTGGFTVYRGVTLNGNAQEVFGKIEEGDVFEDLGFASTSLDPMIALQMGGQAGIIFSIKVPPNSAGIFPNSWLGEKNMYSHEVEFLLPRMSRFKVNNKLGKVWELEVVNG